MKMISCFTVLAMFFLSDLTHADDTAERVFGRVTGKVVSGVNMIEGMPCGFKGNNDAVGFCFNTSNDNTEDQWIPLLTMKFNKKGFQRELVSYLSDSYKGASGSIIFYYDDEDNITSFEAYHKDGELVANCLIK